MNSWAIARRAFGTEAGSGVIVPNPCGAHARIHDPALRPRRFVTALSSVPVALRLDLTTPLRVEANPSRLLTVVSSGRCQGLRGRAIVMPAPCESVRAPDARARSGARIAIRITSTICGEFSMPQLSQVGMKIAERAGRCEEPCGEAVSPDAPSSARNEEYAIRNGRRQLVARGSRLVIRALARGRPSRPVGSKASISYPACPGFTVRSPCPQAIFLQEDSEYVR